MRLLSLELLRTTWGALSQQPWGANTGKQVWRVEDLPCLDPTFMEASGDWLFGRCKVRASRPPM